MATSSEVDDSPQTAQATKVEGRMPNLEDVRYVHRITVGSSSPEHMMSASDCAAAMAELNRCLSESPKGKIIGMDRSFTVTTVGEHQVVLESISYHVGFPRRPLWLA